MKVKWIRFIISPLFVCVIHTEIKSIQTLRCLQHNRISLFKIFFCTVAFSGDVVRPQECAQVSSCLFTCGFLSSRCLSRINQFYKNKLDMQVNNGQNGIKIFFKTDQGDKRRQQLWSDISENFSIPTSAAQQTLPVWLLQIFWRYFLRCENASRLTLIAHIYFKSFLLFFLSLYLNPFSSFFCFCRNSPTFI